MKTIRVFNIILCSSICLSVSCKNNAPSAEDKQLNSMLSQCILEFEKSDDTSILHNCYAQLKTNSSFAKNNITSSANFQNILIILSLLKDYEKLDKILKNKKNRFEEDFREEMIHMNDYRKHYEKDYPRAVKSIQKIISAYEKKLKANPTDSIAELQLYIYGAILNGKEKVFQKIDSIQKNNPKHADWFYDEAKELIEETSQFFPSPHFTPGSASSSAGSPEAVPKNAPAPMVPETETVPVKAPIIKKE